MRLQRFPLLCAANGPRFALELHLATRSQIIADQEERVMTNLIFMASSLTRNATLMVVLVLLFGITATISTAQTYTDLHDFNCSKEGCNPQFPAQLAQGAFGNLTRPHRGRLIWPHLRHKNPFPPAC